MNAKPSGVCKVDGCGKAQVRDGFCKHCADYHIQKTIISKLNDVSEKLSTINPIAAPQIIHTIPNSIDDSKLVEVLLEQSKLLSNIVSGLSDLKNSIYTPSTIQSQTVKRNSIEVIEDDLFIPSLDNLELNNNVVITGENATINSEKNLSSIVNKLSKLNNF